MHMYYAYDNHIYSFSSITTYVFLDWQTFFFFLIYADTFEIVHTSLCIQNTNAYKVLTDSHKYFTFVSHIFIHIYDPLSIPCLAVILFLLS